jgi:hypothetical protein
MMGNMSFAIFRNAYMHARLLTLLYNMIRLIAFLIVGVLVNVYVILFLKGNTSSHSTFLVVFSTGVCVYQWKHGRVTSCI